MNIEAWIIIEDGIPNMRTLSSTRALAEKRWTGFGDTDESQIVWSHRPPGVEIKRFTLTETSVNLLSKKDAFAHMENGGQVFRNVKRKKGWDRFFYKIENGHLMCRVNECGGWHPAVGPLRDTDALYVATVDWKTEGWGRDMRTVTVPLPLPNATLQSENYEGECLDQSRHSGDCEIGQTTTGKINIALVDGVKRMALSFPLDHARRIHDRLGELLPNKKITTEETAI